MAVFKFVINDSKTKRSCQVEVDQSKAADLIGKKIGEEFNGDILDMSGYVLQITGGTDKDGFPMHSGLKGQGRKKMLLSGLPAFKPYKNGMKKRKTVRGDTVSDAIVQINAKVVKAGDKPVEKLLAKKEEKPAEKTDAPKEAESKKEAEPKKEEAPKESEPKKEEKVEDKAGGV